jgi:hypothetical protein
MISSLLMALINSQAPAAAIAGIDIRNAKSSASVRLTPRARMADMVIPLRDTPGINATTWARPVMNAVQGVTVRLELPYLSAAHRTMPNTIRFTAIIGMPRTDGTKRPNIKTGKNERNSRIISLLSSNESNFSTRAL